MGVNPVPTDYVRSAAERTRDANLERARRRGLTAQDVAESFSRPEIELMKAFMAHRFEPIQQYPVGPWDADFYFPAHRVAVEVDGKQHFTKERWAKDRRRDKVFWRRYGIRTLRVRAEYVMEDPWACVRAIERQLAVFARPADVASGKAVA